MSTSGSTTSFELTRDDIINSALRKIGALSKGQTADSTDLTNGAQALTALTKTLQTEGMPLWKRTSYALTLVNGTQSYTIPNAIKLAQMVLTVVSGTTSYPIIEKSRYDFNRLPTSTGGIPVHYYFQPAIQDGTVYIWPTPDATTVSNYNLTAIIQKEFDDFTAGTDTPDFPQAYTDALIYGLAVRLAPEYGLPLQDRELLMKEYMMYKDAAFSYGDEDGSLFLQPDMWLR